VPHAPGTVSLGSPLDVPRRRRERGPIDTAVMFVANGAL
jgi:hypothetical protein